MDTDRASTGSDPLDRLAEEFLWRRRCGERPTPGEYAERHPEHAARILELFPALELIERLKPAPGDAAGLSGKTGLGVGPGTDPGDRPRRLGDYTILREIGRGGMGVVYEAEHDSLKSRVALKLIHDRFRSNTAALRRFRREAQSAARLHHTNIVPVFDYGEQDGVCYYAMQFIAGVGLEQVLEDVRRLRAAAEPRAAPGPSIPDEGTTSGAVAEALSVVSRGLLTGRYATDATATAGVGSEPTATVTSESAAADDRAPAAPRGAATRPDSSTLAGRADTVYFREVVRLAAQVADALDYAHRQGVVHRDIKPANLLLDAQGNAWVADFGLAKLIEGDDLSQSRDLVGTLRFMAPERFEGVTDPRGDVYALGATLYELLTLLPAFDGPTHAELVRQIREQAPVPPRRHDPRIPRDLETIVLKALAKDSKDRFATAAELRDELVRYREGRPIRSRPIGAAERAWRWCRRNPSVAALLGAVAGLIVALAIGSTAAAVWFKRANDRAVQANIELRAANERERARFDLAIDAVELFHGEVSEDFLLKEEPFAALRAKLLRGAAGFYTKLEGLLAGQTDRPSRVALARAYDQLAELTEKIGSNPEALAVRRKALAVHRELADSPAANTAARVDVARSLIEVGSLQQAAGDSAGAMVSFEEARQLAQVPVGTAGADTQLQAVLGMAYQRIATLLADTGRPAEALASHERALAIQRALAEAHPDVAQVQSDLAQSLADMGRLLIISGKPAQAATLYERTLAIRKELADAHPGIVRLQSDLATSHHEIGYVLQLTGTSAEALTAFEQEQAILRELTRADPNVTEFQFQLARCHDHIGWVFGQAGRPAESRAACERAILIYRRLAEVHPTVVRFRRRLAACLHFIGGLHAEAGRSAEAAAAIYQAVGILERFMTLSPFDLYNLSCGHAKLAEIGASSGSGMTPTERQAEADRAMQWLNRAVAAGYRNLALMRTDPDLKPLRSRPDFRLLLMDLEFPSEPFGSAREP
jgi:serine/threonine-protein kinase